MPDYAFTIFSGIAVVLCVPSAYFYWKIPGRPWATLIFVGWIIIWNLIFFVDSIIWGGDNLQDWWDGEIYCDIDARIKDAFGTGLPGAAIGVCRFLADAANPDPSAIDVRQNMFRRNMIDLFIGVILPFLNLGLKFICEPSRYWIVQNLGCMGQIDISWPSFLVYIAWAPLLCLIAAAYACTILFHEN
jgi:pheromone a factor receptor